MSENPTTDMNESRVRRTSQAARLGARRDAERSGVGRSAAVHRAGLGGQGERGPRASSADGSSAARPASARELGPDRHGTLRARAGEGRPAVRRPRLGGQLAVPARAPGLPRGRRDRRWVDHRRRRRLARRATRAAGGGKRARRARSDELRMVQPDRDQGDRRHRWRQPRPRRAAVPPRLRHADASAGDGRHEQVRGRRQPRGVARIGRAPHRGVRADPLQAVDRPGAGRCRCCSSRRRSTSSTCSTSPRDGA